jgi:predicted Zn finger-like uncharacterized protein
MKISCPSCQSKYAIADEKVLGRIVKIRCKKCEGTIVINGNDVQAPTVTRASNSADVPDETWILAVGDDPQTLTTPQVVDAYRSGTVTDTTYVWRDGTAGWTPLRDVQALYDVCTLAVRDLGPSALEFADDVGAVAARRAGGRGTKGDLFAPEPAHQNGREPNFAEAPKLTGQRHEDSVLFTLQAAGKVPLPGPAGIPAEASGLIDIRALGANPNRDARPQNKVDDIMNLAGGGAFSPALASAAMTSEPSAIVMAPTPVAPKANFVVVFAIVGLVAFLTAAAVAAFFILRAH